MPAPEGHCWLCNRYGKLSKEHIPPESAFNDCPLLLQAVDERSNKTGVLEWTQGDRFERGIYFRSLCENCNNKYGRLYGGAYVDLVRRIAERIGDVQQYHRISLPRVRRPLAVLKQVMLQFVTANGAGFVSANNWVAPFVRSRTNNQIPPDVAIYLFASNMRSSRKSGVSAHMELGTGKQNVVAEFTFWPLGTVISWGELSDNRLTPIHHWANYSFNDPGTVDLELCVNPVASAYPIDFRSESQIQRNASSEDADTTYATEDATRDIMKKALARSGTDEKDWIVSGHPNTFAKVREGSR